MKSIEKTCLALLLGSLLLPIAILFVFGLDKHTDSESLFVPPADGKSRTSLNMVLEADNLEGLKKICALWATQEDRTSDALDALIVEGETLKRDFYIYSLFISVLFVVASSSMYFQIRKLKVESKDAP